MFKGTKPQIFVAAIVACLALVACGSGGSSGTPPTGATPSPTPAGSGSPSASPTHSPTPSPSPSPTPSPTPAATGAPGTIAVTIVNNNPNMTSSGIHLYIFGQDNSTFAWEGVNANGTTYAIPSVGNTVAPIAWTGSGNSDTVFVPQLTACRVYMVQGTLAPPLFEVGLSGYGPSAPAPWSGDASKSVYFDNVEYTWNSGGINIDTSQVDSFNLPLQVKLNGSLGTQTFGFLNGAVTQLATDLNALGSPWSTLTSQMPYRVTNPSHGDQAGFFPSTTFLDTALMTAWNSYQGGNFMTITAATLASTQYTGAAYGTVDASSNFNWYSAPDTSSTLLGTMYSPAHFTSSESWTMQMFEANDAFVQFSYSNPLFSSTLMPAIGDRVSGALNRGVMNQTTQPACTGGYPGAAYQNQFANYVHQIASNATYGYGAAYGYPYDDLCGLSTDTSDPAPTSFTITIGTT